MSQIRLVPADGAQKPVIANLIQLYLHDLTAFMPFPIGADGRFQYEFLERFWRYPYFICCDDDIAGFALVVDACPLTGRSPCWFMAEFFVLRAYRGRGLGQAAVDLALAAHPGVWHVGVPYANTAAQAFWRTALRRRNPLARDLRFDGDDWRLHVFEAASVPG